jgi:hypothetical protein
MVLHLPDASAFPGMWRNRGADTIKPDLEAAGIPYRDKSGEVLDFHA